MSTELNQGYCYKERLTLPAKGVPVLTYLADRYRHSSKNEWLNQIENGRVQIDGKTVNTSRLLLPGETLSWHRPPWVEPTAPTSFAVLHYDNNVLVVAKPRGLPAMPGGGFLQRTLLKRVLSFEPRASPLHRLGRETSGITLFTLNRKCRRFLAKAWQEGRVERKYITLVRGVPKSKKFSVTASIGTAPHPLLGSIAAIDPSGKNAKSVISIIEQRTSVTLVEVQIDTGRTHQIRIHLAASGHPLVGDPLYPIGGIPDPKTLVLPGQGGFLLHAYSLRFPCPTTRRDISIWCHLPPQLRRQAT